MVSLSSQVQRIFIFVKILVGCFFIFNMFSSHYIALVLFPWLLFLEASFTVPHCEVIKNRAVGSLCVSEVCVLVALPLNNQTESLSLWGLDVNILSLGLITVPLERHFLISSYVYKPGFCNLDSGSR